MRESFLSWCNLIEDGQPWPVVEPYPNSSPLRDEQVALARHVAMCWDKAQAEACAHLMAPGAATAQEAVVFGYWAGIARGVEREQEMANDLLALADALPEDERLGCLLEALRHRAKT